MPALIRSLSLALITLALPDFASAAASPFPQDRDADSFFAAHAAARELLDKTRWPEAEVALTELLTEHAGADYVRPHLQDIRTQLRHAAFWKGVEQPDVSDLLSGELLHFSATTGVVRIRYTHATLGDFDDPDSGFPLHPMSFSGSWSVEIEGTPKEVSGLALYVSLVPDDGYSIVFGHNVEGSRTLKSHGAFHVHDGKSKPVVEKEPRVLKRSKRTVKAKISVGEKSITMTYDGRRVASFKRGGEGFGQLALSSGGRRIKPFGQLTIAGPVDPGWLQGVADAAVSAQRKEFDASWKEPSVLAAWALREPTGFVELTREALVESADFVVDVRSPEEQETYEALRSAIASGRPEARAALARIEGLPEEALSPSMRALLVFQAALMLERPTLALEQFEALHAGEAEPPALDVLRAELLYSAARYEEALDLFMEIALVFPAAAYAYGRGAELYMLLGREREARQAIQHGREAVPSNRSLQVMEARFARAAAGPAWGRVNAADGAHSSVRTDADATAARHASGVLDDAWARCRTFFGPLPDGALGEGERPLLVYLFSGRAGYLDYVRSVSGEDHSRTLGTYLPALGQTLVWSPADRLELVGTLRHEVTHRYLELALGRRIPRWLSEGLAECFVSCWDAAGTFEPDRVSADALFVLESNRRLDALESFMRQSDAEFLSDPERGFAQAWALVHFLRRGSPLDAPLLERLRVGLAAGTDPQEVIDRALADVDVNALQQRFDAWLEKELRRPR